MCRLDAHHCYCAGNNQGPFKTRFRPSRSDFGQISSRSKPTFDVDHIKSVTLLRDEDSAGSQAREVELERSGA